MFPALVSRSGGSTGTHSFSCFSCKWNVLRLQQEARARRRKTPDRRWMVKLQTSTRERNHKRLDREEPEGIFTPHQTRRLYIRTSKLGLLPLIQPIMWTAIHHLTRQEEGGAIEHQHWWLSSESRLPDWFIIFFNTFSSSFFSSHVHRIMLHSKWWL